MTTFINKKFVFFILLLGSIAFCQAMEEQRNPTSAITIAQQLTKNAQLFLQPLEGQQPPSLTLNNINSLAQQLANNFTQSEWNNDYETAQAIRDSIRLSLIDNLMRAGAHDALTNLAPILTPKKDESPSPCYTKIKQALSIPSDVYNSIAQARITGRWEELLALKQKSVIQNTPAEQLLNQTSVELMEGIYPIPSLKEQSLQITALYFDQLVKENKWETIKKQLESLPKDVRIQLINLPVNSAQKTLLDLYIQENKTDVVVKLLCLGAQPRITQVPNPTSTLTPSLSKESRQQLFQEALNDGNIRAVKQLIFQGVELENIDIEKPIKTNYKKSVLPAILDLLIRSGFPLDPQKLFHDQRGILHFLFDDSYLELNHCHNQAESDEDEKNIIALCKFLAKSNYSFDLSIQDNDQLTVLDKAILYCNSSLIHFILTQADHQEVDLASICSLNDDKLSDKCDQIGIDCDFYIFFLLNFLDFITNKDLTLAQRLNSIHKLSQWVQNQPSPQKTNTQPSAFKDYQTFLSLCNFSTSTFDFGTTSALNLSLKYKSIPLFNLIYYNTTRLETDNDKFAALFDSNSMRNLFQNIQSTKHTGTLNKSFIKTFFNFLHNKLSYEKIQAFNILDATQNPSPFIHQLFLAVPGFSLETRIGLIKKILQFFPSLRTKPDFYGNTPLQFIMTNEKLAKNRKLVALFNEKESLEKKESA